MTFSHQKFLIMPAVLLGGLALAATTADPGFSARGRLLFSDDFNGSVLDSAWKSGPGAWEVATGALRGSERPQDHHAAVRRHPLAYHDAIFEFAFQFDGAKALHLSLNGAGGHVCRLVITPKGMSLMADKPNAKSDLQPEKLAGLDTEIGVGSLHKVVVEVHGTHMLAQLDGKQSLSGESQRVDVDKVDFGFPVQGVSASIDYVRAYEIGTK